MVEASDEKIEQAELDAYIDAGADVVKREDRIAYLKARYEETKQAYDRLVLQHDELVGRKVDDGVAKMAGMLRDNYKARKYFVKTLRSMGETVDDRFVPA